MIGKTAYLPYGTIRATPDRAAYRIDYTVDNNSTWARLSTHTNTVWGFSSQRPAAGKTDVVPLLLVGYDIPLDLRNRARAGLNRLKFTVRQQAGAPVAPLTKVTLQVSADDGTTWKNAWKVIGTGGGTYVAVIDPRLARHGHYMSLRVNAADSQGDTVSQEIIRAFAIARSVGVPPLVGEPLGQKRNEGV